MRPSRASTAHAVHPPCTGSSAPCIPSGGSKAPRSHVPRTHTRSTCTGPLALCIPCTSLIAPRYCTRSHTLLYAAPTQATRIRATISSHVSRRTRASGSAVGVATHGSASQAFDAIAAASAQAVITAALVPAHLVPAIAMAWAIDDPPTAVESQAVRALVINKLPPAAIDGQSFSSFVMWWVVTCAQLNRAGLLKAVGGKDGSIDPTVAAGPVPACKNWEIKQAGSYLFSCVSDTVLFLAASEHMDKAKDLRGFIFENCCPKAMVEREVQRAILYLDLPRFRHANELAWFREIRHDLNICATFANADYLGAGFAKLQRSEADVVDTFQRPSRDGKPIVPWSSAVAEKIATANCTTLAEITAIIADAARFSNVAGTVVDGGHISSIPGHHVSSIARDGPHVALCSDPLGCSRSGCRDRHTPTPSERRLLSRITALTKAAAEAASTPAAQKPKKDRNAWRTAPGIGDTFCRNFAAGRCHDVNCPRKHVIPKTSSLGTSSLVADIVAALRAPDPAQPPPTAAGHPTVSALDFLQRYGKTCAVPMVFDATTHVYPKVCSVFGASNHGASTGFGPIMETLNDGGSSICGTGDPSSVTDVVWFAEPMKLSLADDNSSSVALGYGLAHYRLRNDEGDLVAVPPIVQYLCPGFGEDIISAPLARKTFGARWTYKEGLDHGDDDADNYGDADAFYYIRKSRQYIPILIRHNREFVASSKLLWTTTVPSHYQRWFPATTATTSHVPNVSAATKPVQRLVPSATRVFADLDPNVREAITDGVLGTDGVFWGAGKILQYLRSHSIDVDRRAACQYRDAAGMVLDQRSSEAKARLAAFPRPHTLHHAAQVGYHAVTGNAPTPAAMVYSDRSIQAWASLPDDGALDDMESWREVTGLGAAARVEERAAFEELASVAVQEQADALPQSSEMDALYYAVGTSRGDLPGVSLSRTPAYLAVSAVVAEHCDEIGVPFSLGNIVDVVHGDLGLPATIASIAHRLSFALDAASPLEAEPPPHAPDIAVLRTCLIHGLPAAPDGLPVGVAKPTWPVTKASRKRIDAMSLPDLMGALTSLPPRPITPDEQAAAQTARDAASTTPLTRNEVQYVRLRAARMGCYSWSRQNDVLMEAHELLGHRNWADVAAHCRQQGYKLDSVAEAFCDVCLRVKTHRNEPSRAPASPDDSDLLTRWHCDVSGPHTASRLGGHKYATVFCSKGGTALVYYSPNMLNFQDIQARFLDDVEKLLQDMPDHPPIDVHFATWKQGIHVCTDGAPHFTSKAARVFWRERRVHVHVSASMCPALNGAAERMIKTLGHSARCSLLYRDQPQSMWAEAWQMAELVHDVLPTDSDPDRLSPQQQRTGVPPDRSKLHPAFCPVYVWSNPNDRDKSMPGARRGIYIGWDRHTDCARVLIETDARASVVTSRHLRFVHDLPSKLAESIVTTQYHAVPHGTGDSEPELDVIDIDALQHEVAHPDPDTINLDFYGVSSVNYTVPSFSLPESFLRAARDFRHALDIRHVVSRVTVPDVDAPGGAGKSGPTIVDYDLSPDDILWLSDFKAKTRGNDPDLHYNYGSALRDPKFGHLYEESTIKELNGLFRDKGCLRQIFAADLPAGARVHRVLPLFHPKYHNGTVDGDDSTAIFDRCKTRITFNGSGQMAGIDYDRSDTNQPTFQTWRLHMGVISGVTVGPDGAYTAPTDPDENFTLKGDMPLAYTNAVPERPTWVELPRDLARLAVALGLAKEDPSGRLIACVLRCQYGQCDAGRLFEHAYCKFMLDAGFTQSAYERCLFYRGTLRVCCHTDDFMVRGRKSECVAFADEMNAKWGDCKIVHLPTEILSWNISYDHMNCITLSSLGQINSMLKSLDMERSYPRYTPLPSTADPAVWKSSEHVGVTRIVQSMTGSLNHIAQTVRLDIAFACNQFGSSQYMPSAAVIPPLRHCYKYMFATKHLGISYGAPYSSPGSPVNQLDCWVDASDGDGPKNRSQTGWLCRINGGPCDWGSGRQSTTSLNTAESELKASCTAARSTVFLIRLLAEFGYPPLAPVTVWEDNTTTIKWCRKDGPSLSQKNKHIDRQYFYCQGLQSEKPPVITMIHVPSADQLADLLTKNLARDIHSRLCARLLVDTASNGFHASASGKSVLQID